MFNVQGNSYSSWNSIRDKLTNNYAVITINDIPVNVYIYMKSWCPLFFCRLPLSSEQICSTMAEMHTVLHWESYQALTIQQKPDFEILSGPELHPVEVWSVTRGHSFRNILPLKNRYYVIVIVCYFRIYGSKPQRPRAQPRGQGWFNLP